MAVAHNAVSVAIVGLIGGFLSPVLLSTGTNHPYVLFTYIAVLDAVAIVAAYFRRWRAVDLLCLVGTALMYQGWYLKFYEHDQMTPALIYVSLFYLIFLVVPLMHSLIRRLPEEVIGLVIVVLNATFFFYCYYNILFHDYRHIMGFVTLGQALLVFSLFRLWSIRIGKDRTAESLLIITLALVTLAIPIHLDLYAVALAWAVEGVLFAYLGIRFKRITCRIGGVLALVLAGLRLISLMPLHTAPFTFVFNRHFGSWLAVIIAAGVAAYILWRNRQRTERWNGVPAIVAFLLGFGLGCILLTAETWQYWSIPREQYFRIHRYSSLAVLWSLIPAAAATVIARKKLDKAMLLLWLCYAVGCIVFIFSLFQYRLPSSWLMANYTFCPRLVFVLSLWWGVRMTNRTGKETAAYVLESISHALLLLLLAVEFTRWGDYTDVVSSRMAVSLISAAWSIHAFALIWVGLAGRTRIRRILGFVLFAVAAVKILAYDTQALDKVYRIVSYMATGLFALAAAYFYQRYSRLLFGENETENGT